MIQSKFDHLIEEYEVVVIAEYLYLIRTKMCISDRIKRWQDNLDRTLVFAESQVKNIENYKLNMGNIFNCMRLVLS